jgi:hypothetical protein
MGKLKKYYKLNREPYPMKGFVMIDLMENDMVVGGYIVPDTNEAKKFIIEHVKKEGYGELCKTKK